jgi:hypothetical protein
MLTSIPFGLFEYANFLFISFYLQIIEKFDSEGKEVFNFTQRENKFNL